MTQPAIRITAEDIETGERGVREIAEGDYCLIPVEPLYLDGIQRHANGTIVLTLKRRRDNAGEAP